MTNETMKAALDRFNDRRREAFREFYTCTSAVFGVAATEDRIWRLWAALERDGFRVHHKRQAINGRAAIRSKKVTPELEEKIAAFAAKNPELSQQEIGHHFDVAGGRVSETLAKRQRRRARKAA